MTTFITLIAGTVGKMFAMLVTRMSSQVLKLRAVTISDYGDGSGRVYELNECRGLVH